MATPGDLHEPVRAGRLELRNRIVMPAHTTNFAVDGGFSARHRAYHRARAAGGAGLIITEGMRVHATSLGRTNTVSAAEDGIAASLGQLVETVHGEGAKLAAQLLHVGRQAGSHLVLTAPWGASPIPWSPTAAVPHQMTTEEIATVVAAFGAAATRVAAAGVDAVEVHLGHGHLLQQFLSPASNHRTDDYGGTLPNRLRFAREALDAVTTAAPDLPVILRISGDEFLPGGLDLGQMLEAMRVLLADHAVDLLHVSHSAYVATASVATQMADMSFPPLPFRHLPKAFKKEFPGLAVLAVGRVDDLDNARALVADGDADLVALARPHIAVPDLVARDRDGDTTPVRECIACNQGCAGRLELGLPISCVVNPEAGLEREWAALRTAAQAGPDLRVLVVGGGPAGMEAALSAASAGHRVTLVEAERELGGALRFAARLPMRARFGQYVDQLAVSVRHAGVEIRLGTRADAALLAGGWDHVVVATGARDTAAPADSAFPAIPLRQAVAAPESTGAHVVLVDEDGTTTALALADLLLSLGRRVTLVTDRAALSWRVPVYSRPALLDRLRDRGFGAVLMRTPVRMSDGAFVCADPLSRQEQRIADVTTVVFVRTPAAAAVHADCDTVVGDAYAPRTALEAAFEGRLAGLAAARTAEVRAAQTALRGRL
ncbi:oxidoreductase [Actinophytocola algeriensis]|uniref:2,4-dienoyl-CoA reductase-like NADH-dependent reductase (Old Yellow Enzyme family)/CheY-like chemotaxis protein n=1 Tax=Actinophytocola algeriensis TaxID=1768010 RepID=A0A7W7Q7T5_9PSEU|nr:FAD-dependent oxidoreductase [Actinophytocola algeriensis]MBB4908630.1 2,4-dienoyl-CoA reductase-like NADH-dependent reductase (Old Yellow Enzyme family)/CheY-like chemotaxis protein [Actinophytocola algeriensis]MBE1474983.1 2,4-dienoyl-CoA reductase-like NADH-dependent reductase (Old Yellow Enzyme family)/CheY-like chemotaxis protein [Actinophytocola algeriensis]